MLLINSQISKAPTGEFDKNNAYSYIVNQLDFGPRYPGSDGHQSTINYIASKMISFGWEVTFQTADIDGFAITNIISKTGFGNEKIIIGTHYDTRKISSNEIDHNLIKLPVPGANDGASGVAVMLEIARNIPNDINKEIYFVFFDYEDNGNLEGANWAMGSRFFAKNLEFIPDSVVIIDMVGDKNLSIFQEINSDENLNNEIWGVASDLGYKEFINQERFSLLDDHTPFINAGMNAVLIIDFDYDFWHLSDDNLDKISKNSLKVVGDTILAWVNKD